MSIGESAIGELVHPYLNERVSQDEFSGVVLLAKDGTPVFQEVHGQAHKGYQIPNQINTKFNTGSATKMFTALAIAQLAEQGRLDFSDPLGKHLAEFPEATAERVTLHHLLTHTAGAAGSILNDQTFRANKDLVRTTADWMPFIVHEPLLFEPGTAWSYSNAGFLVLGAVIEKITGKAYFDYVHDHIWQPAEMHESDASPLDVDVPHRALGYMNREEGEPASQPRKNNYPYSLIRGSAHGGAWSTAHDLIQFAIALQNNLLLSAKYTKILLDQKVSTGRRPGEGYAYGFFTQELNRHLIAGHGGIVAGFNTWFDMYADLGYTVIILSNYGFPAAQQVGEHIRTLLKQK